MKNKYLITLGGLTSLVGPIAVISCSCSSKTSEQVKNVNFESEILKIKDNSAILDLTIGSDAEREKWLADDYDDSEGETWNYIDETYQAEVEAILNWASEMKRKDVYIKIASVYYDSDGTKITWIMKLNPNFIEGRYCNFETFMEKCKWVLDSEKYEDDQTYPEVKGSSNIEHFNNPNW